MPQIIFEGRHYDSHPGETVLETLLKHGALLPSKCKTGTCRTCMVRVVSGTPPAEGQKNLKDTLVALGFFLPCCGEPEEDLEIAHVDVSDHEVMLTLAERVELSDGVVRLRLHSDEPFRYRPGQYVNLVRPRDEAVRSYCLASAPEDDHFLEVHVQRRDGGDMSRWLCDELPGGGEVGAYGPAGDCFFLPNNLDRPILLAAADTGMAPAWGILGDALRHGHRGPITVVHGAVDAHGLYLDAALKELAAKHEQVTYVPVVMGAGEDHAALGAAIDALGDLKGWRGYLCGPPGVVKLLRKKAFLNGAASADLYAVAFGD